MVIIMMNDLNRDMNKSVNLGLEQLCDQRADQRMKGQGARTKRKQYFVAVLNRVDEIIVRRCRASRSCTWSTT